MKVAILAHSLRVAGGLAVGKNFIRTLKRVAPQHAYLILIPPDLGYEEIELPDDCELIVYKGSNTPIGRLIYDNKVLPEIVKEFEPDVVLAMANAGFKNIPGKQAVLVQDSHMLYDKRHYANELLLGKLKWRYQKHRMRRCIDHINMIFCQTPVTRERFAKVFNYPEDKIEIMPNAVSGFEKLPKSKIHIPDILIDKSYYNLFYLAKFYAHKNFEILIDLFRHHADELNNVRCIVTISPGQHKHTPKFLDSIKKYKLGHKIINVGPLEQEELANYFTNCDALLFPSLLESFSGTYLEAMHFGLPILTSDLDFARYICGDVALYFNPWDAGDIAQKIAEIRNRPLLRKELVNKERQRVSKFFKTWEQITNSVIEKLERLHQMG